MNESAIAHRADLAARDAIAGLADRLSVRGGFLRALFLYALDCARTGANPSGDGLAASLHIRRSTMSSCAFRHQVSIREVLNRVQLIRAAALLERPDISVGMTSLILGASSEQAFCRTIVTLTRLTPARWRTNASVFRELFALEMYLKARMERFNAMPTPGRAEAAAA